MGTDVLVSYRHEDQLAAFTDSFARASFEFDQATDPLKRILQKPEMHGESRVASLIASSGSSKAGN